MLSLGSQTAGSMPERWQEAHIFSARQAPGGGSFVAAPCPDGALRFWPRQVKDTPPPPPPPTSTWPLCASTPQTRSPWGVLASSFSGTDSQLVKGGTLTIASIAVLDRS